jgi:hypothetical protein
LVQLATFFFVGDPHSYIKGGRDAQSHTLFPPHVERESKGGRRPSAGAGNPTASSPSLGGSQGSSSSIASSRRKSGQMPIFAAIREMTSASNGMSSPLFRPLSSWGQKRDTTPILVSLLNWLLCPISITRAYVDTVKGIGGNRGGIPRERSEEAVLQERIQAMQRQKPKKGKKGRKGGGMSRSSDLAEGDEKQEKKDDWTACPLDRVYRSLDWFLGRLFGPDAVSSLSSLSFSSRILNNNMLRQVLS